MRYFSSLRAWLLMAVAALTVGCASTSAPEGIAAVPSSGASLNTDKFEADRAAILAMAGEL